MRPVKHSGQSLPKISGSRISAVGSDDLHQPFGTQRKVFKGRLLENGLRHFRKNATHLFDRKSPEGLRADIAQTA